MLSRIDRLVGLDLTRWRRGERAAALQRGRPDARPARPARLLPREPRRPDASTTSRSSSRTTPDAPAREVFDRYARSGWRYVRPDEPLAMHDNFERAVSEARGDYVAVVIDKTILHPSALEVADAALAAQPRRHRHVAERGLRPGRRVARCRQPGASARSRHRARRALRPGRAELAARFANASGEAAIPSTTLEARSSSAPISRGAARPDPRADRTRVSSARARLYVDGARLRACRRRRSTSAARCSSRTTPRAPTAGGRASTRRTRGASSRSPTRPSSMRCRSPGSTPLCTTSWPTTSCRRRRAARRLDAAAEHGQPRAARARGPGRRRVDRRRRSARRRLRSWTTPSAATASTAVTARHPASRERARAGPPSLLTRVPPLRAPRHPGRRRARRRPRSPRRSRPRAPPTRHYCAARRPGMKAVILAGGRGSRLSEETVVRPKPLVEIGGRPIIWHIMNIYAAHGIVDFVVCAGYKGYLLKEYFANLGLHDSDVTFDLGIGRGDLSPAGAAALAGHRRRHRPRDDDRRARPARSRASRRRRALLPHLRRRRGRRRRRRRRSSFIAARACWRP